MAFEIQLNMKHIINQIVSEQKWRVIESLLNLLSNHPITVDLR